MKNRSTKPLFPFSRWLPIAFVFTLLIWSTTGCSGIKADTELGSANIGVAYNALSASDVAKVTITISGTNISPNIVQNLVQTGGQWKGIIGQIPAGTGRTFLAQAYDGSNNLIYEGQATNVTIQKGTPATVVILLQQKNAPNPFANEVPVIGNVTASSNAVGPGETVNLVVSATDSSHPPLSYAWTATGGSFSPANAATTTWTAPTTPGNYTLTITVTDAKDGLVAMTMTVGVQEHYAKGKASISVSFNTWPEVGKVTASKGRINTSETTDLDVVASDSDSDTLSYNWASDCGGSFSSGSAKNPTFTAPSSAPTSGKCKLTVTVSDSRGGTNTGDLTIEIGAPIEANKAPQLTTTFQSDDKIDAGASVTFRVVAEEPESQSMTFSWSASAGTLGTPNTTATTSEVVWTAASSGCSGDITVTVKDSENLATTYVFSVGCKAGPAWGQQASGSKLKEGLATAVDSSGNTYVGGVFQGTISFGTTTFSSVQSSNEDGFVGKLDSNGSWVWAKHFGAAGQTWVRGVAVDSSGNVYVTGEFSSSMNLGAVTLTPSGGGYDVYVAKLDSSGNLVWATNGGGTGLDMGRAIAVDSNGNVFVAGIFNNTASFGTTDLTSSGSADPFVAKLNSSGAWQWARRGGGNYNEFADGVAVDSSGNVYYVGHYYYAATFGTINISYTGNGNNGFVAKLDTNGNYLWAKDAGNTVGRNDEVKGIAIDSNDNIYLSGFFNVNQSATGSACSFGSTTISSKGGTDIFIAKMDTSGNYVWAKSFGGSANDENRGIAVDGSGNVYATGFFQGTASFDTIDLTSAGGEDVYLAKLNSSGAVQAAFSGGGASGNDRGNAVATTSSGAAVVTGRFQSSATFGSVTLTTTVSSSLWDMFVTKFTF